MQSRYTTVRKYLRGTGLGRGGLSRRTPGLLYTPGTSSSARSPSGFSLSLDGICRFGPSLTDESFAPVHPSRAVRRFSLKLCTSFAHHPMCPAQRCSWLACWSGLCTGIPDTYRLLEALTTGRPRVIRDDSFEKTFCESSSPKGQRACRLGGGWTL